MRLKSRLDKLSKRGEPLSWEVWHVDTDEPDIYTGPDGQTLSSAEFHFYKKKVPPSLGLIVVRRTVVDAKR